MQSRHICYININSAVISYHFIAISTSYVLECCWFFRWIFSVPVISRIESIGSGQAGGVWGGAKAGGKPKAG